MNPNRQEIEIKLIKLTEHFLQESGLEKRMVRLDNSLEGHLGLGSLSRLELFCEVEKAFNVHFDDVTLSKIVTLLDLANLVENEFQKMQMQKELENQNGKNLIELLFFYAENQPDHPHIYFEDDKGNMTSITFAHILQNAKNVAQSLPKNKVIPINVSSSPEFIYTFFGILLAGSTPQEINQDILPLIHLYGQKLKITGADNAVSFASLDRLSTLFFWLLCFYHGVTLNLISFNSFIKSPEKWLWAIHNCNATISLGDEAAYEYCLKTIKHPQIEGLDLSSWRLCINMGNEALQNIQEAFYKKFSAYGLRENLFYTIGEIPNPPIDRSKLIANNLQRKPSFLKKIGPFFYTLYVLLLFLIIVPFGYLCAYVTSKRVFARLLKLGSRFLLCLMFCPLKIYNKKGLYKAQNVVFAANHASYTDILLLMAILPPETKMVAKSGLGQLPIIKKVIAKLGHVLVSRKSFPEGTKKNIEKIRGVLKQSSILIFPEGTFSYASGLRPFKMGGFKVACEEDAPVVPLATQGTRRLLREKSFLLRPVFLKVHVGPLIAPEGKEYRDFVKLSEKTRAFIAAHCGEPSLDFIAAGPAKEQLPPPQEDF